MSFIPNQHRDSFIKLTVFVFIAAGVMAGFCGWLASLVYGGIHFGLDSPPPQSVFQIQCLGLCWGIVAGLLAAAFWCWVIYRRVQCDLLTGLAWQGAGSGISAGLISTLLLHTVLLVFGTDRDPGGLFVGLPIGVVAGLILGFVSGMICQAIVNAKPADQTPATAQSAAPDASPPAEP